MLAGINKSLVVIRTRGVRVAHPAACASIVLIHARLEPVANPEHDSLDRCLDRLRDDRLLRSAEPSANASTTTKPTLWRVPSYFFPGLPRPTTIFMVIEKGIRHLFRPFWETLPSPPLLLPSSCR